MPIAGLAAMLAASVVGCVLPPAEHPALDQARAAVERARSAPRVRGLAAAELDRAEITLERARAAAEAGAPASHVEHLAYVASRQAALAEAHAADRVAQAEIEELQGALGRLRADAPAADLPGSSAGGEAPPAPRIDASLPDLTLALSELAFDEAAPSGETARKLDEVAERLLGEPGRRLSIEADFDLPAPVARTAMERRVETVRAALLRRGSIRHGSASAPLRPLNSGHCLRSTASHPEPSRESGGSNRAGRSRQLPGPDDRVRPIPSAASLPPGLGRRGPAGARPRSWSLRRPAMSRRGRSREGGAASGAFIAARAASAAHFRAAQTRREFRRGDLVEDRAEEYCPAVGAGPLESSASRQLWP